MACVPNPTSTQFTTFTTFNTITSFGSTTYVVVDNGVVFTSTLVDTVGGQRVTRVEVLTGATLTTTARVTSLSMSPALVASPVSTYFSPCPTTAAPTPTTAPTTAAPTVPTTPPAVSSTSATLIVQGGTTITSFTTVPAASSSTSSSAPSSTGTLLNAQNNTSSAPVGAIAGGVVGGVALLLLGALAIWYFSTRGSRNDRDKDFDFAGDDAWDPAAGVASGAMVGAKRNSRGRGGGGGGSQRHLNGGMVMGGMSDQYDDGAGAGYGRSQSQSRKKVTPADEQFAYYNGNSGSSMGHGGSMGHSDGGNAGMAGVGALGRGPSISKPQDEYAPEIDPYGGLDSLPNDGGYAVAGRIPHSNSQNLRALSPEQQQGLPGMYQSNGGNNAYGAGQQSYVSSRSLYAQQAPNNGSNSPLQRQGSSPSLGSQNQNYASPSQQQTQYPVSSIPYHPPSPLTAPGGQRFDNLAPMTSPTPSHRSIPALGAFSGEPEEDGTRRGGPLRVTNEEPEDEDEARFGKNDGAYAGLTDGL